MGTNYSFYVKTIETHARTFFKVIIFFYRYCVEPDEVFNKDKEVNANVQNDYLLVKETKCPEIS